MVGWAKMGRLWGVRGYGEHGYFSTFIRSICQRDQRQSVGLSAWPKSKRQTLVPADSESGVVAGQCAPVMRVESD